MGLAHITFNQTPVRREYILGHLNKGFHGIVRNFNHERWFCAVISQRFARTALSQAFSYSRTRWTFNAALSQHAVIRHHLAKALREVEATTALLESVTFQVLSTPKPSQLPHVSRDRSRSSLNTPWPRSQGTMSSSNDRSVSPAVSEAYKPAYASDIISPQSLFYGGKANRSYSTHVNIAKAKAHSQSQSPSQASSLSSSVFSNPDLSPDILTTAAGVSTGAGSSSSSSQQHFDFSSTTTGFGFPQSTGNDSVGQWQSLEPGTVTWEAISLVAVLKIQCVQAYETAIQCALRVFGSAAYAESGPGALVHRLQQELYMCKVPTGTEDILSDLSVRLILRKDDLNVTPKASL